MHDIRPIRLAVLAGALAATLAPPAALADADLAKARNCVACHHIERKMNGPPYKEIAATYGNDEAAIKALTEKVQAGGGGVWGPMAMPAQPNLTPEDAEKLVRWILSQK